MKRATTPGASGDAPYTTTYRVTVGTHAALVAAAERLKERLDLPRLDVSFILRSVIREWMKNGSKVVVPTDDDG